MKHFLIASVLLLLCSPCFPQMRHLDRKEESKRNEYLIEKSKEVIMTFGPDYFRDYKEPVISEIQTVLEHYSEDPDLKDKNLYGRKYYTVTYLYDKSKENLKFNFAALVEIWAEDGQPKRVMFGSGLGHGFLRTPYKEWIKKDLKKSDKLEETDIFPYIQSPRINTGDLIRVVNDTITIRMIDY